MEAMVWLPCAVTVTKMYDMAEPIDARELLCPEPLMLVRNAMRVLEDGTELEVVATDPSTVRDFTQFCRFMGHELVSHTTTGDEHHFVLRKGTTGG